MCLSKVIKILGWMDKIFNLKFFFGFGAFFLGHNLLENMYFYRIPRQISYKNKIFCFRFLVRKHFKI